MTCTKCDGTGSYRGRQDHGGDNYWCDGCNATGIAIPPRKMVPLIISAVFDIPLPPNTNVVLLRGYILESIGWKCDFNIEEIETYPDEKGDKRIKGSVRRVE